MQVVLSVTVMLVDPSVAIMQVTGDFCCNYAVRSFYSTYAGDIFCIGHVGDNFYCNYASVSPCCKLCSWYVMQCIMHMSVSIVIMLVTVSAIAM